VSKIHAFLPLHGLCWRGKYVIKNRQHKVNPTPSGSHRRSPMLAPFAPRGPSSPEAQHFFPARVGYLGGATSRAQGRTAGEGLLWWTTMQLHDTATTRTTTPSCFRCIYASSGNPVIYNLLFILVYEVENFCFLASITSS